jgi:transcriptional activator of cad operon
VAGAHAGDAETISAIAKHGADHFYQSHQLLMNGDVDSLSKASALLDDVIKDSPDFLTPMRKKRWWMYYVIRSSRWNKEQLRAVR